MNTIPSWRNVNVTKQRLTYWLRAYSTSQKNIHNVIKFFTVINMRLFVKTCLRHAIYESCYLCLKVLNNIKSKSTFTQYLLHVFILFCVWLHLINHFIHLIIYNPYMLIQSMSSSFYLGILLNHISTINLPGCYLSLQDKNISRKKVSVQTK